MGAAEACTGAACAGRAARRWTGAGIELVDGASTGRARATTSPGVARLLTSCPSGWTIGGRPWDPGSAVANEPGAATSGMSPLVRWIGGRLAQARPDAGAATAIPVSAIPVSTNPVSEPALESSLSAPSPELERRPRPNGRRTATQPSSAIRRLICPISSTKRCRSGCSRSRISSSGQWKW